MQPYGQTSDFFYVIFFFTKSCWPGPYVCVCVCVLWLYTRWMYKERARDSCKCYVSDRL